MTQEQSAPAAHASPEVWLRGNIRPVLAAVAASLLSSGLILGVLVAMQTGGWVVATVSVFLAAGFLTTLMLAYESARPRLTRQGGVVHVRLAPWQREAVPLEVMECFFLGSSPVGRHPATSSCGSSAEEAEDDSVASTSRRRGTLAIRLAERATDYSQRSVSLPWGGWARGTIVIDGLWCEPLTPSLVRTLTGRLVAAKREA